MISARLQRVLDSWDPYPAHVTGRRRDVVAWNRMSDVIYEWSRLPQGHRNVLRYMFLLPSARRLLVDWEREAPLAVAALRAEAGHDVGDPDYQELIQELLSGSPDFAAFWARQDVRGRQEGTRHFKHPKLGNLELEFTTFQVAEQPSLHVYLSTPVDQQSANKLRRRVVEVGRRPRP